MRQTTFDFLAGVVFLLVAIVHLMRIVQGWDLVIAGTYVPFWVNWVGLVIAGILSFYGFAFSARRPAIRI